VSIFSYVLKYLSVLTEPLIASSASVQMPFFSSNQKCQSTEGNTKYWPQTWWPGLILSHLLQTLMQGTLLAIQCQYTSQEMLKLFSQWSLLRAI